MGRLEKIVVLTVLFLVAVILGVSLNQGGDPGEPARQDALASAPAGAESTPQAAGHRPAAAPEEPKEGPAGMLHTSVGAPEGAGSPAAAVTPDPQVGAASAGAALPGGQGTAQELPGALPAQPASPSSSPPGGVDSKPVATEGQAAAGSQLAAGGLVTKEGLSESLDPGMMVYTWAAGDTFPALAERYFGSTLEVGRLRQANEGRHEGVLRPGDRISVPCRPIESRERLTKSESAAGQWEGGSYRVKAGDMLGKIAQEVYGSASKWRLIYDANRDILASPDDLQVGMALRIPAIE